jgi:hypothetical protein
MNANLSAAGGFLEMQKDVFLPALNKECESAQPLLKRVQSTSDKETIRGLTMRLPYWVDHTSGATFAKTTFKASEGGATQDATTNSIVMPTPGSASFDQMTIPLSVILAAAGVPQILIERMEGGDSSWVKPWAHEMTSLQEYMTGRIGRLLYGDKTGKIATVVSFSNAGAPDGSDLVTVDSTLGLVNGEVIDFVRSGSDVANGSGITVTAKLSETTFSCTMSGTPQAGDLIVHADSYNQVTDGLESIIATTGTFQGVARANYYWAQANVVDNSGASQNAAFYPLKLKQLKNAINRRAHNAKIVSQTLIATSDVLDAIPWTLYPDRRFDNTKKMEIFDNGASIMGLPFFADEDCTANTIYLVNFADLILGRKGALIEQDKSPGGQSIERAVNTSGLPIWGWVTYFKSILALAARRSSRLGKLTYVSGLTDGGYGSSGGYA